ncbi:MAG TPA: FecR family protein [Polyangiaceae bacterium]|nr:FecR family protein [Polyangiaceae bacterium]
MTSWEEREKHEAAAMALGDLARRVAGQVDDARDAAGRERWLRAVTRPRRSPRGRAALLAAALVVGTVLAFFYARPPARLEYSVTGPLVADETWLGVAPSGEPLSLRFSDGTELDLGPGSRGRVAEVTGDGASLVLAAGVLQARVVHRPRARWSVSAGPYTIEVTGTAFDVAWSDVRDELELTLHDGGVLVRGPSLADGLRVAAGQRLVAHASTGLAQLSSILAAEPPPKPPAAAPEPSASPAVHLPPRPPPTWSEMLADGNFRGVLDAAAARGIDATLNRGSLADVVALADAARYLHERGLARRGLLTERSRFAGSPEARGAAFVLGRMADDAGSSDEAIRWYDTYLAESSRGPFAAEALGRKLVTLVESGDAVGARAAAREYLARFPSGAHAAYARDHGQTP